MNERDELAIAIHCAADGIKLEQAQHAAQGVLSAGYRKLRPTSTAVEKDELAHVITNAYRVKAQKPFRDGHDVEDEPIAEAILKAGYRKPHIINTPEHLENLLGSLEWDRIVSNAAHQYHQEACSHKPRTITTAEELDALPVGAVVRSAMGVVYEKNADLDDLDDLSLAWLEPIGDSRRYPARRLSYPAIVLWEPR